jgi:hypothetical protein
MNRDRITAAFLILVSLLAVWQAWEKRGMQNEINTLRSEVRVARLATENSLALNEVMSVYADQWRRRATQYKLELDDAARELKERPVVETTVTVTVPAAQVEDPEPEVSDSAVTMTFEDDWLTAEVEYRPVDVMATLSYELKPITLKIGVRCGSLDTVSMVRPAIVTVEQGLLPVTISIEEANIDPDVCNAPVVVQEDGGFDLKSAAAGAAGVLAILLIGR